MHESILYILTSICDYWVLYIAKYWLTIGIIGSILTALVISALLQYTYSKKEVYSKIRYKGDIDNLNDKFFIFIGISWIIPIILFVSAYSLIIIIPFIISMGITKFFIRNKKKLGRIYEQTKG